MSLEEHYSGDEVWNRFYAFAIENPLSGDIFNETTFTDGDSLSADGRGIIEVAVAYYGIKRLRQWLTIKLPDLEGKTPWECVLEIEDTCIRNRLREYLMRPPA